MIHAGCAVTRNVPPHTFWGPPVAALLAQITVLLTASFHIASVEPDGVVREIEHITKSGSRVNGGFFVFRREIFNYIQEGEELVEQPFRRLIAEKQLIAYPYDGFWACMDTFKEKQHLEELYSRGKAPWEVWRKE